MAGGAFLEIPGDIDKIDTRYGTFKFSFSAPANYEVPLTQYIAH